MLLKDLNALVTFECWTGTFCWCSVSNIPKTYAKKIQIDIKFNMKGRLGFELFAGDRKSQK